MSETSTVTKVILHCQKQIKKNPSEEKLLHYLARLRRLRIELRHLENTGIGKTVNQLGRLDGRVGQEAFDLVTKWKALVEAEKSTSEESSSHEDEDEDEDEEEDDEGRLHIIDQQNDSDNEVHVKIEPKFEPRIESKYEPKVEPKYEPKIKVEPTFEPKVEPKFEHKVKIEPTFEHKVEIKVEPKVEKQSDSRPRQLLPTLSREIDYTSGVGFADVLSCLDHVNSSSSSKKKEKSRLNGSSSSKTSSSKSSSYHADTSSSSSKSKHNGSSSSKSHTVDASSKQKQNGSSNSKASSSRSSSHTRDTSPSSSKHKQNGSSSSSGYSSKSSSSNTDTSSSSSKSKRTAHEDKHRGSHSSSSSKDAHKKHVKTESVILPTNSSSSTLISPNYKPSTAARIMAVAPIPKPASLPPREILNSLRQDFNGGLAVTGYPLHNGETRFEYDRRTNEDALSTMISSRNQRTKVYSGVKSGVVGTVPKLFELCIRVIQDNINDLGFTGGVPYDILKPVLDRASADQLFHIENYNPYLIENTDDLWRFHCSREFRGKQPQELESWRELYTRCVDERKARFQSLTKKVRRKQETATPQMKTKLAYVDTTAGPKFSRSKTETIKNGMKTLKTREEKGIKRTHGSSASAGGSGSSQHVTIEEASVIISAGSKAGTAPAQSRERESYSAPKKPKKAPLMQKTMKIIKTLYRR